MRYRWPLVTLAIAAACDGGASSANERGSGAIPSRQSPPARSAPASAPTTESPAPGAVDSPCGGQGVVVTFSVESFAGIDANDTTTALRRLRALAAAATKPVQQLVVGIEYSPAIRTIRLALRDSASVRRAVSGIGQSSDVSEVALDACALTIQRKAPTGGR